MKPHLFVDVDDTLIRWGKEYGNPPYSPNLQVIHFIRTWREFHKDGHVTVWSTGGKDWAAENASKYIPGLYDDCMTKHPRMLALGEIYLDDDPLPCYKSATVHPDALDYGLRDTWRAM